MKVQIQINPVKLSCNATNTKTTRSSDTDYTATATTEIRASCLRGNTTIHTVTPIATTYTNITEQASSGTPTRCGQKNLIRRDTQKTTIHTVFILNIRNFFYLKLHLIIEISVLIFGRFFFNLWI